jgi:SAM-dependent methyltransferase
MQLSIATFTLKELAKNVAMAFGPIRSLRLKSARTSLNPDASQVYRYAFWLPDLVLKHVGPVDGKDILEIGPGDHLATGLTFLALGAKSYTCLDRFPGAYSNQYARSWYEVAREHFPAQFSRPWPNWLSPATYPDAYPQVSTLSTSIEQLQEHRAFDVVCSFAVGEHVTNVDAFAMANRKLLRPTGQAVHYVDFGGHFWEKDPKDPLMFTRIPRWLWNAMGSNRGYPNRVPFPDYTSRLERAGLNVRLASTKPFPHDPSVQEAVYVLSEQQAATAALSSLL